MNDNKKQNEIKKAHDKTISSFRYYNDKLNKQDLFISVSCEDYNIKLWNFNKMELIVNIEKIYSNCFHKALLKSACFLNDNNQVYILASDNEGFNPVKVFNFKGELVKDINELKNSVIFIDVYYDKKSHKNYILISNECYLLSFDYIENKKKYYKESEVNFCGGYFIFKEKEEIELIESCYDG